MVKPPFYISEYYGKILDKPIPARKLPVVYRNSIEFHIRKFPNNDSRNNFNKMIAEALAR